MSVISLSKAASLRTLPTEEHDIMEQILEHLGGMGRYQQYLFFMMMPVMLLYAFVFGVQMFVAATPGHWCYVPELQHLDAELRRNLSIPGAASGPEWSRCSMFAANWSEVVASMQPPPPGTPTTPCSHGWEFTYEDIPYTTVVSEREWVCDKASYAPSAQSLFYIGSLIGSALFGWMGDKFGRVPAFIIANVVGCVGGVATTFTSGFWDFSFCRFLVGLCHDTGCMLLYILVLEYVGPRHRSWVGNLSMAVSFSAGGVLLPGLAYWLRDWSTLLLVTSLPMLGILVAPWAVPESARWLALQGRVNKAVKVLRKFERVNKSKIPDEAMEKFVLSASKKVETDESMAALFRSPPIRNAVFFVMVVSAIVAIQIDAVIRLSESIGPNFFVTYAISSLSEIPALLLVAVLLDKWGRRLLSVSTLVAGGVLCLICAITPQGLPQLVLVVVSRFCVNMTWAALNQLGAEVLPTGLRALGTSLLRMTMFVAVTASPFVVYSGTIWQGLPLVILGAMGLIGGGIALLLPETKGQPMPQTIADGERIIREGRLCGKPEKDDVEEQEVTFIENKNAIGLG